MSSIDKERLVVIERFKHDEIVGFIKEKALTKTWLTQLYMVLTVITICLVTAVLAYSLIIDFKTAVIDVAMILLLVPIWIVAHEGAHGIAYKFIGARKVEYDMMLSRFIFFTIVYEELFSFKQLLPVLLAPTFGLLPVPLYFFMSGEPLIAMGLLCFHILSIGGDLYLLNYYLLNRHLSLYTEDLRSKETLIYKEM